MLSLLATSFQDAIPAIQGSLPFIAPELVIILAACALLILDLFMDEENSHWLAWPAVGSLIVALWLGHEGWENLSSNAAVNPGRPLFLGMLAADSFGAFFRQLFLFGTLVTVVLAYHTRAFQRIRMGEFYALLFSSVAGMSMMAMATDFLMVFIGIELVSIPSYVLTGYLYQNRKATEASLKYLLYGAFSSGLMLFGVSIIYGLTGTTKLSGIATLLSSGNAEHTMLLMVTSMLVFAGYAYKLAAAPFHFWAPDVYEGAPTPITAWLSVASKAAGIAAFVRFLLAFAGTDMHFGSFDWSVGLAVIAAITMTVGNVSALLQTNVKRILAYSSVAHVGYLLMGLTAVGATVSTVTTGDGQATVLQLGQGGASAAVFYAFVYLWMNLGAFAVVIAVADRLGGDDVSHFRGLGRRAPSLAIPMVVYLFALIGLPPTAGFTGKLQLFMSVINSGGTTLAIIAGVNTAISVYFYFKIIRAMYLDGFMDPANKEPLPLPLGLSLLCMFLTVPVLYLGLFFNGLGEATQGLTVFLKAL